MLRDHFWGGNFDFFCNFQPEIAVVIKPTEWSWAPSCPLSIVMWHFLCVWIYLLLLHCRVWTLCSCLFADKEATQEVGSVITITPGYSHNVSLELFRDKDFWNTLSSELSSVQDQPWVRLYSACWSGPWQLSPPYVLYCRRRSTSSQHIYVEYLKATGPHQHGHSDFLAPRRRICHMVCWVQTRV